MKKLLMFHFKVIAYRLLYALSKIKKFKIKENKYKDKIKFFGKEVNHNQIQDEVIFQDCPLIKRQKKILIIGRNRTGDSIGNHTKSFLETMNPKEVDIYVWDEYTQKLWKYTNQNTKEFVSDRNIYDINGKCFDITIFCNVIDYGYDNGESFMKSMPLRRSLINYVYAVFEGTVPPKNWVNIINKNFDGLLVPIDNLKKIFSKYGVMIPIFVLPVALNLKKHLEKECCPADKIFRFGWSGTLDPRKNPIKVLQAFVQTFKGMDNVELYIHSRAKNNNSQKYIKEFYEELKKTPANVHFIDSLLSNQDYFNLIKSFDAYVFPSRAEGYSVTPREALALGKVVILSDIFAHKNICSLKEKDGVFWCKANIAIPAVHVTLNNQICGNEYDISLEELKDQMKKMFNEREKLYTPDKIKIRKNAAEVYSVENLKSQYQTLICPEKIEYFSENILSRGKVLTNDFDLINKYQHYLKCKKINITIDPANDAGFCSLFNKYVSHLVYAAQDEVILPDWRLNQLKINKLAKTGQNRLNHFCYGKEKDGNIFLKFFEKPYPEIPDEIYQTNMMYYIADKSLEIDDYNASNEPNLTYIHSYKLYEDSKYFPVFRRKYHNTVKKYIILRKEIQEIIDNFYNKYMKGKFIISVHIRCQSHALELLEDYPTFEMYEKNIIDILKKENLDTESDNYRLFIASDNEDAINYFSKKYPKHCIYQKQVKRLTSEEEKEYKREKEKNKKDIPGFELQERNAQSDGLRNMSFGIDIITDAWLLAKGDVFLFVNSNVSTAVSYLNPDIKMVYCKEREYD